MKRTLSFLAKGNDCPLTARERSVLQLMAEGPQQQEDRIHLFTGRPSAAS
jgi:hypothetical protein